jgi:hypothetical protein
MGAEGVDVAECRVLPELQAKLDKHVKGAAGLVGLFVKPQ